MRPASTLALAAVLLTAAPYIIEAATCASAYAQCGGTGFSGPTCCVDGYACVKQGNNEYYSQCIPAASAPPTTKPAPTTTPTPTPSSGPTTAPVPTTAAPTLYKTYDQEVIPAHAQGAYPTPDNNLCGQWKLDENVCVPQYCANDNVSETCNGCLNQPECVSPPAQVAKSGTLWGEKTTVSADEKWHYSRSTHYGITSGGACGFGLYALCTQAGKSSGEKWIDPLLADYACDAFCKAYPLMCQDPTNVTLRGNFAAPTGNYYTQFWPHLAGARDNYLSCGECFELTKTKKDGTDFQPGEKGYTSPVVLQITDSCPCENNDKWCCGPGHDHCGEVSDYKYGCPLPADSHHLDLSDIAMGRVQGDPSIPEGLIPTRYRRVPCPMPGNVYMWIHDNSGPYYMALSFVNAAGVGSIAKVDIMGAGQTTWTAMETNQDFIQQRPQNRYGAWTIKKDSGPFNAPLAVRITSPNGEQLVNMQAIKTFTAPTGSIPKYNYVDFGLQFSMDGKH